MKYVRLKWFILIIGICAFGWRSEGEDYHISMVIGKAKVCPDCQNSATVTHDCSDPIGPTSYEWAFVPESAAKQIIAWQYDKSGSVNFTDDADSGSVEVKCAVSIGPGGVNGSVPAESHAVSDSYSAYPMPVAQFDPLPPDSGMRFSGGDTIVTEVKNPDSTAKYIWVLSGAYKASPKDSPVPLSCEKDGVTFSYELPKDICNGYVTITCMREDVGECSKVALYAQLGCPSCGSCNGCSSGNCDTAGKNENCAASINSTFSLGHVRGSGVKLKIYSKEPNPDLYSPKGLVLDGFFQTLTKIKSGDGSLRQIIAPECEVDIVQQGPFGYLMNFYSTGAFSALTNGVYLIRSDKNPFVTYVVTNPAASSFSNDTVRIIERRPGSDDKTTEFTVEGTGSDNLTRLTMPGGAWQSYSSWVSGADNWEEKRIGVGSATGSINRLKLEIFPWGKSPVEDIEDPDGLHLVTKTHYDANHRIVGEERPDGSWVRKNFNDQGELLSVITPWGDASYNTPDIQCKVTEYEYSLPGSGDNGLKPGSPRIVRDLILGCPVAKTYFAFIPVTNNSSERMEISERCLDPNSAFGAMGNQRTISYYSIDDGNLLRTIYPDGRMTVYEKEMGTFAEGANPGEGAFTAGSGEWERNSSISATETDGTYVAGRTVKDVSIENPAGRTAMTEQYVFTGGTSWARIGWTWNSLDEAGRAVETRRSDGTVVESTWACCGKDWEKDASGAETSYVYDELKRLTQVVKAGADAGVYPEQADQYSIMAYDAAGREISRTRQAGVFSLTSSNRYDAVGRVTDQWDEAGLHTATSYATNGLAETRALPSGASITTTRYRDGRPKSETGSGTTARYYEYGVETDGRQWTQVFMGTSNSPMWEMTWTDSLGRTVKTRKPGASGLEDTENHYDSAGRLDKVRRSGLPNVLYTYNEMGEQDRSAEDVDGNDIIDFDGPDRVTGSSSRYENWSGTVAGRTVGAGWFRVSESLLWPMEGIALCVTSSVSRQRLSGFSAGVTAESVTEQANGMASVNWTEVDREAKLARNYSRSAAATGTAMQVTCNGLGVEGQNGQGVGQRLFYDALGRQTDVRDGRGQDRLTGYDNQGRVSLTEDEAGNQTVFGYDEAGRRTSITDPLTNTVYSAYDAKGQVLGQWGGTYPVFYNYDDFGRMTAMYTIRTNLTIGSMSSFSNNISLFDKTEWRYDDLTGLMTNKVYADGTEVGYAYTTNGLLATRTWARMNGSSNVVTTYSYANGQLIKVDYDGTPDIDYTLDRMGRQVRAVVSGVSTSTYAYNSLGQMVGETNIQIGLTVAKTYRFDSLGRPSGLDVGSDYAVRYGYDGNGRFLNVTSTIAGVTRSYTYNWDQTSGLLEGWSSGDFAASRGYEAQRPVLSYIQNTYTNGVVSRYDYTVDAVGRRTVAVMSGSVFKDMGTTSFGYSYNSKGELTNAKRAFGADPEGDRVNEQVYNYIYDQIGNRTRSDLGKWTRQFTYSANNVNQYTQRSVPDEFPFYGTASTSATVLVNNALASRYGMYYSSVLTATNSTTADYKKVVVEAAATNSYTATTGRVFVAKTPEVFTYDADGNMTSDGRFTYEWNAENRLEKVKTLLSGLPTNVPVIKLVLNYDHQGRRISMVRSKYEGGAWVWLENRKFIYDGWNLVGETRNANSVTVTNWYVWGLDLSGTLQGAGGVGGLLNASFGRATPLANYIAYDGNGNVTDLIGGNGVKRAHYEYDPFGNPTTETGTLAASNPFRFSTKYWDDDTKLSYYGHRYYGPGIGRWLSSDPIGERGGTALKLYIQNEPVASFDPFGLSGYIDSGPFYRHWLWGDAEDYHVDFSKYDPGWGASDFPEFQGIVAEACSEKKNQPVDLVRLYDTGAAPGQVDVHLRGTVVHSIALCKWSFSGNVSIDRNLYDFDSRPYGQRDGNDSLLYPKENATRYIGRPWGGPDSTNNDYWIIFDGSRSVGAGGACE